MVLHDLHGAPVALQGLFASPIGNHLVFKGGTSLAKGYGIIQRFSEDLDLTYDISFCRKIIDDEPGAPPTATYQYHFGGILPAYERIRYDLQRRRNRSLKDRTKSLSNTQLLDLLRKLRRRRGRLSALD